MITLEHVSKSYGAGNVAVGDLSLDYVSMRTPDDPDLALVIYSAPSGSTAEDALKLLAGVRVL